MAIAEFDALERRIEEILDGRNAYIIPNFQRNYSWEKSNYEDFLNDLLDAMGATVDDSGGGDLRLKGNDVAQPYFFGTILLVGDRTSPSFDNPYIVVDGQQRLTTISLFYAVIINLISQIDNNYDTEFKERLIAEISKDGKRQEMRRLMNPDLEPYYSVDVLDLNHTHDEEWPPSNRSQEHFNDTFALFMDMLDKGKLMKRVAGRISKNIKDYGERNVDNKSYLNFLNQLGEYLSNSRVIAIYTSDRNTANTLYRNFNYRGKPLGKTDLIKNELFAVLDDDTGSVTKQWECIEKNTYQAKTSLELFFYHFMLGRYSNVTKQNLFSKFESEVKLSDYSKFIEEVKLCSEFYKEVIAPGSPSLFGIENYYRLNDHWKLKVYLRIMNSLGVSQPRILLLGAFKARSDGRITDSQLINLVRAVTMAQSAFVLATARANTLTGVYKNGCKNLLSCEKNDAGNVINTIEKNLFDKIPSLELITNASSSWLLYGHDKHHARGKDPHQIIRLILGTIAESEQADPTKSNSASKWIYDSGVTLEHICDLAKGAKTDNAYKSLGNLLLLEQAKHTNIKDKLEKQKMYESSAIDMTRKFGREECLDFDVSKIEERRRKLLASYYNIVKNTLVSK